MPRALIRSDDCRPSSGASHCRRITQRGLGPLFADSWEFALREDPLFATNFGDSRFNDRLPRETLADQRRRFEADRAFLARLEKIPHDRLSPGEQLNYDIFARLKRDAIAEADFQAYLMPITNRSGFHISFPELPLEVPLANVRDYENYIPRLRTFSLYVDDHLELMREGIKQGLVLPSIVMADFDRAIRPHLVDDPAASLLHKPFTKYPETVPAGDQARLTTAGSKAIRERVVPGYRRLLAFLTDEYVPACREQIGESALPRGASFIAIACGNSLRWTWTRSRFTILAWPRWRGSRPKCTPSSKRLASRGISKHTSSFCALRRSSIPTRPNNCSRKRAWC